MFGNKQDKQERLDRILAFLTTYGEVSIARLGELVGVPPKTIYSDLRALHEQGILLQEYKGKISFYQTY